MHLRSLLDGLPAHLSDSDQIEIADIAYDSRQVRTGSLFVALPSVSSGRDGNLYIQEAVAGGAVAIVTERVETAEVPIIRVPSARQALADLAARFYHYPTSQLNLFAVTGTDGKTTATYLLEQILAAAGYTTGLIGTVEVKVGGRREWNLDRMTTPESLDLQRLLHSMVEVGVTHVALEASSHGLALDRLRGCSFAACGLTNITADHVEFHGSWEAYFQAKAHLFTKLNHGPAILNRDDPQFDRLRALISGEVMTYGFGCEADLRALDLVPGRNGISFGLHFGGKTFPTSIPLPGHYNVSNALAAAGLALSAGISLDLIATALEKSRPPAGRLQRVASEPVEVIVDYAHTVHAFRSVLSTLRERTHHPSRLIAVFGATGDRDREKRPVLAALAREYADFFIITNEDPYGEDPEAIVSEIISGVPADEEGVRFVRDLDRASAVRKAIERARPGDTVIILGKGHERSMVVKGRKEAYSDVEVARHALGISP